ncbi:Tail measure [Bifidobacterium longum subsp. longum]|uniref:Tail measure n=1 Tax=Bifidobacterium longum subsp. longum TaxID=1679 RepID=A0A4R0U2S5_BIFLL|nr:Tail measure [Bifidobacterium longum subsp. longum]
MAEKWANWVDTAERTGQVSKAMEKAIEQGGYLKSSVFDLIGVFEGTLGTLAKTENGIQGFSEALEKANKAVHTIKFQETLEAWSAGAQDAQDKMRNAFKDIGDAAYSLKDTTRAVFGDAGQIVGEGITGLSRVLQQSGGGIRDFSSGVRDGFSQVFDAVGDAGPMFSDLASMVGQLSRTFGGTFASALRTVSPLISTIAKGATGVAQAFDSLPGPVKSIITLWATFGRAGKTAFESLKTGMLQNIQSTMRYQKMLSELGLSAEQASVKMGTLIKAMNQLRSGNYAGILSGAISEVNSLGMAAEANSKKLLLPGNAAKETSKDMGGLVGANGQAIASIRSAGEQAEQQSGRFGSLKTGVKNLWDAFGGWTTVAGLGISAGIAVIGNAISDYTTKAEASKQAMDKVIDGMKGIKSNAKEAADAFNDFKSETTKQWDDPSLLFGKDGGGAVTEWLVKVSGGYTSAADAAKRLGINTSTLTDAVSGNEAGYKKLVKQLEAQSKETYKASDQYGMMVEKQTDAAIAADTLLQALKKQHKEGLEKSVKEQMKYLRSLEQISDSSSALSDKLSSLATTVKANGQAFKENGELADANNAAYVRTDKAMKDVAATALLSAHQLLSYGEKNGQVEEYTQKAANSIYEAREAIVQQAQAAGMSEEAAERYADSLGLIPSDVGTTITAHSEIAQDAVDKLVQGISGLTDGEKEIVIRLREAGVVTTLDGVLSLVEQLMKGDLSERDLTLLLNAKGNARWETGEVKENLLALGMSKKAYKWLFSGEGNAEERMQKVRDELGYLNLTDEQIQWILDCIDHASGKIKDVEKNKVPAAKGVSFNIDANDDDAQVKLASYRESDGEKLAENNILVSAVDNTSEGTESAKANVFSVPHEWWSWLFGLDGTSGPSGIAKNAVESIPQQWQSILTGSGNTTLFSNIANNAVRNIPQQWLSMFTGLGNTPSFAGTARSMIGKVPTYHSTTLNAMGNALDVASNLLSTLRSIAGRTWTAFIDTISGGGGHATGGRIYGPGTSTSDSIPAMLSNGEMVLRAAAVKKIDALYGRSFLNTLNAVGSVEKAMQPSAFALNARRKSQAYATGGRVSTANGSWNIEVNPVVNVEANGNLNAGVRELNNRVDELNRQVGALAAGLPSVISENSSPWPSQRAFNRDVRGAL